jgi:enoyl-CoA hydratase/carnithine racemase
VTSPIDTGTDDLLAELHDDGVLVATLNRPDTRNAFSGPMGKALSEIYRRADTDDAVRVVVVTGTPPAFCAGADFSGGSQVFERQESTSFSANPLTTSAWQIRKPVIAAVNGHAIGIGFTITLQCDVRIFAADAKYGIVQTRRGVMGDGYSHWTLPRIAGMSAAAEILLSGRMFDGHEAKDLGVCSRVLPNDEVLDAALGLAHDIAENTAPLSVAYSKRLLWATWDLDAAGVERVETSMHHHLMAHPDAKEGPLAFLERRPPNWSGTLESDWPEEDPVK